MFACEHAGITPDIMCLAKGYPVDIIQLLLYVLQMISMHFYADYKEGKSFYILILILEIHWDVGLQ